MIIYIRIAIEKDGGIGWLNWCVTNEGGEGALIWNRRSRIDVFSGLEDRESTTTFDTSFSQKTNTKKINSRSALLAIMP